MHYETDPCVAALLGGAWVPGVWDVTVDNLGMHSHATPAPAPASPPLRQAGAGLRLLAIETSTDRLSVAAGNGLDSGASGGLLWQHSGPGAAQASATLLPAVRAVLAQAGWALDSLDALVFGRGPGSFTGLRTACAVAQGLAFGAQTPARPGGLPVLPVDTLLALANEALHTRLRAGLAAPTHIAAVLDARMNEVYLALYPCGAEGVQPQATLPAHLCANNHLAAHLLAHGWSHPGGLLAGNALEELNLPDALGPRQPAWPTAAALLRLAPGLLQAGHAVPASQALPMYVRDQVARTTAEREAERERAALANG